MIGRAQSTRHISPAHTTLRRILIAANCLVKGSSSPAVSAEEYSGRLAAITTPTDNVHINRWGDGWVHVWCSAMFKSYWLQRDRPPWQREDSSEMCPAKTISQLLAGLCLRVFNSSYKPWHQQERSQVSSTQWNLADSVQKITEMTLTL